MPNIPAEAQLRRGDAALTNLATTTPPYFPRNFATCDAELSGTAVFPQLVRT